MAAKKNKRKSAAEVEELGAHDFVPTKGKPEICEECDLGEDAGQHTRPSYHPEAVDADFVKHGKAETTPEFRRFLVTVFRKAAHEMNVGSVTPARALEIVCEEIEALDAPADSAE